MLITRPYYSTCACKSYRNCNDSLLVLFCKILQLDLEFLQLTVIICLNRFPLLLKQSTSTLLVLLVFHLEFFQLRVRLLVFSFLQAQNLVVVSDAKRNNETVITSA